MSSSNNLRAVELFAGIGGFRIAGEKFGLKTVWANDIDKDAATVYKEKFGDDSFVEGDIWKLLHDVPDHDILTAGFPCQPFSSAGKKKGIEDPRGTLFGAIVEILKKHEPDYFILENVKRLLVMEEGRHFATILASLSSLDYKIEWRLLNARDFSLPQNRQRVVITGVHKRKLSKTAPFFMTDSLNLITSTELASFEDEIEALTDQDRWRKIYNHASAFKNWGVAYKGRFFDTDIKFFSLAKKRVLLKDVLESNVDDVFDLTETTEKWINRNTPVNKFVGGVEILSNQAGGARMGYTVFGANGLAPTLTSSTSRHYERYLINGRYRRLTPTEYALIQGFPHDHCDGVSKSVRYVLCGNAVPPPLVEWVMERILRKPETVKLPKKARLPLRYAH